MTIFKLLKSGFNVLRTSKNKINQLNEEFEEKLNSIEKDMDRKHKIHSLKHAFKMEDLFLSVIAKHSKEQSSDKNINLIEISDIVDTGYKNLKILNQFSDRKTEINLIDMKKDYFINHFEKIELPIMADKESQKSIDQQYSQLLAKRQDKFQELRVAIDNSEAFTKVICAYLARSNYPKKNAFDILPKSIEGFFDNERSNSLHLKGVKILDSILD